MSNPLVDRILGNPLTFVTAKAPEKETAAEKHPSYIVLGNDAPQASQKDESTLLKPKKQPLKKLQPRSMADAIAAYTGKKYMTKAERKRSTPKPVESDEGEPVEPEKSSNVDVSEEEEEEGSDSESQYELASEFQTDSSFHGFRSSSEEESKSETADAEAKEETSSDNDNVLVDEEDELDDESYDGDAAEVEDSDEDDDDDEEEDEPEGDLEEEDASDESNAEEDALEVNDASSNGSVVKEDMHQLRRDLLDDAKKTTPPTSPETAAEPKDSESKPKPVTLAKHPKGHYNITETAVDRGQNGSQRIIKNWTKKFQGKHPVGLLNFGVTCYMNSAIQLMVHIPAVQHYLLEVLEGKHELPAKSVTHTVAELSSRMWGFSSGHGKGPRKFVNPKKVIQRLFDINCMMSEWQQEDSHEYFMSLMSRFQEDSTPKGKKLNESIIYDIFGGLLQQEVTCRECNTVSTTKQEFYDLSLGLNKKRRSSETEEIPCGRYSIEKSINDYFSTETIKKDKVDESSGYHCEKCKKRTVASKKSMIERSPETLMVHLKRFKFNGSSSSKVKQAIVYPGFLDLAPYTMTQESTKYQLISVIVHEGRSILSGHYICHCLQPDGSWSTYDDEYINKTDERKAMSDPSAYCLIYTKLTPKGESTSNGEVSRKRKRDRGGSVAKKAKH